MIKLGEIFVSLKLDYSQYSADLKKQEQAALSSAQRIEKANDRVSKSGSGSVYEQSAKSLEKYRYEVFKHTGQLNLSEKQIQTHNSALRAGLPSQEAWNKAVENGTQQSGFFGHNIEALTKRILVTSAALTLFYGSMRLIGSEFVAGLSAVEDYKLKVASMGAFLTTFSTKLTKTNAAEIYRESTAEAQKLVAAMERLDAKTIASGKDLNTMAEQFIKGGVKIDTTNQATMDGFANIANALKLMTQGQNQEIQMRQEIRALVQGQMKDTNLLAKTLQSIDPNIKEHIKLWKQQGTLIENVGGLLAGFGPATKDLENTWAVVGSTMETIHNRVLRGMFKGTYDSLLQTAKDINSTFQDSDGFLTPFAQKFIDMGKSASGFLGSLVSWSIEFGKIAAIAFPLFLLISSGPAKLLLMINTIGKMTDAMLAFNIATMANPIFIAAAAAAAIYATIKIGDAIKDMNKEQIEAIQKTDEWNAKLNEIGANASGVEEVMKQTQKLNEELEKKVQQDSMLNLLNKIPGIKIDQSMWDGLWETTNKGLSKDSWLYKLISFMETGGKGTLAERAAEKVAKLKEEADKKSSNFSIFSGERRNESVMGLRQPAKLTATGYQQDINIGQQRSMIDLSASDLGGLKSALKDPADEMKRKNLLHGLSEEKKMVFELTHSLGKYKESYDQMIESGNVREANEAKNYLLKVARDEDSIKSSDKEAKTIKKNNEALANELEKLEKKRANRIEKSGKDIDEYYSKLQTKLESLGKPPGESEELANWAKEAKEKLEDLAISAGVSSEQYKEALKKFNDAQSLLPQITGKLGEKEVKESNIRSDKLMEQIFPNQKRELKSETLKDKLDKEKALWDTYTEEQKALSEKNQEYWVKAYDGIAAREDTWINGALDALDRYKNTTTSTFKTAGDVVERSFKGMEDALVEFVKTGKISFTSLIDSLVTDLIRYQIQQSVMPGVSSLASTGISAISSFFGASANGNVFNQNGFQKFANGGAFTNSVVSKPTIFPFANGTGLMGEAGPEAIMPLKRTSSGALGVISEGGGGMSVIINNYGSEKVETKEAKNASGGKSLIVQIGEVVANDIKSGGPVSRAMKDTFGMNPRLATR